MLAKCCCCAPLRAGSVFISAVGFSLGIGILFEEVFQYTTPQSHHNIFFVILHFVAYGFLLFGAIKQNMVTVLICAIVIAILVLFEIIFGIIVFNRLVVLYNNTDCDKMPEMFEKELDECKRKTIEKSWSESECHFVKMTGPPLAAGIHFIPALLNGCFWLYIYSFYKQLKGLIPTELNIEASNIDLQQHRRCMFA